MSSQLLVGFLYLQSVMQKLLLIHLFAALELLFGCVSPTLTVLVMPSLTLVGFFSLSANKDTQIDSGTGRFRQF